MGVGKTQNRDGLVAKIIEVAQPLCQAENFELVHLECIQNKIESIVKVYIDKPGGITVDDCVYISRQLGDLIDVTIDDFGRYRLEVSSPGPKRPLKNKADYQRFKGQRVKIETHEPVDGQKKFTGVLDQVDEDSIIIAYDGKQVEIKDLIISKATLAGS
ncbi:MAG: ribosome maturation factor RimP [Desulfobacteraceae bacterium]|nr:ribosome maturation factor RimP [Desulfobacteraceae bacterium]